eukprot:snap_masked-scaffold_1-processed-gene-18.26-mRNA-1 protein AED:1.00 eAED:1.00 QI:0/0/0/0/1/1/4/0/71
MHVRISTIKVKKINFHKLKSTNKDLPMCVFNCYYLLKYYKLKGNSQGLIKFNFDRLSFIAVFKTRFVSKKN